MSDPIRDDEKRSYGALFLLTIGLLLACTVWAIWQDSFSRHLWKKYKADFYRFAISRYTEELAADAEGLAAVPEYVELGQELAEVQASLASGDLAERLDVLAGDLGTAEVKVLETDLENRFVTGEIEEVWYLIESGSHAGRDVGEVRRRMAALDERSTETSRNFTDAKAARDVVLVEIDTIRGREAEIEAALKLHHAQSDAIRQKLEGVSLSLFGRRFPRVPTLEQTVLPVYEKNNFNQWVERVDRCQNCHVAIDRAGFEDAPNPMKTHPDIRYYLGNHEKLGCTPCHGGQGPSVNSVEQAHGEVHYWEDPMADVHDKVQGRCLNCHASVQGMQGTEVAARGESLFRDLGCHGCHLVDGFEDLPKAGPSLKRVAAKVSPEWLVEWIDDPHAFRPRTRMPQFFLDREESTAIAAYLLSSSFQDSMLWLDSHPEPGGIDPADAALVADGRALTESLGCLGCHGFGADEFASQVADGKDTAPNLARIAEKSDGRWIYHWIKDPRGYSETARMPRLRLSDEEAQAISSYLLTLSEEPRVAPDMALRARLADPEVAKAGEKLVRTYGCFGCHPITGTELESRIGVELNTFGSKHVEELFFGDRLDVPHSWDDWTINKVLTPRTYQTERIAQVMPEFGFEHSDARALTVFLSSRIETKINDSYRHDSDKARRLRRGREVVSYYNCQGCHSFDGKDGAIRSHYEDDIEDAPPILQGEGMKLQPEWFFDFIMKPVRLRPWLKVRMPTFGFNEEEATAIVDYFMALDDYDNSTIVVEGPRGAGPAATAAAAHTTEGAFDCYSCHAQAAVAGSQDSSLLSSKGLSKAEVEDWLADHLGIEGGSDGGDNDQSLGEYLGTGGAR
ncbi:MAG: c-type cytochrome [Deltaproteobacteria bacterium]